MRALQKKLLLIKNLSPPLEQVTIKNNWLSLQVLNFGAIIQKLKFRTGADSYINMVVGFDDPSSYLNDPFSLGACVGRFAGRLSGGEIKIDGATYPIWNQKGVTLHGGERGFARRYWDIEPVGQESDEPEIRLNYKSQHLEEGFPGTLKVHLTYRLQKNALLIRQKAVTDHPTIVNLTNHSYFKIDNHPDISHYKLRLSASQRLETDDRLLPTGKLLDVNGTDYDFKRERDLGNLKLDTPFVLDNRKDPAAELYSMASGLRLKVYTNQPGIVIFTPGGMPSICFETQNFPDAPRFAHFPSALLRPGETYLNETRYVFEKLS